ncbi:uncharacterized protein B0H64DRAFT_56089 [Chaetomium fimeti]|jgi:hypothetical protein|uniref:MARVEL domain-containing protein n=1 Tax=Chaetomium fimeti TaxID=1854472 RepID=A0AAE0H6K8_9PEZI|nr:hypothetical protein B0H64DRAFT_56089 [Chaetomium fimeti]
MLFGIMFACWRFLQIVTLIPIMGMLAWFVNIHLEVNVMTPTHILVMFIVSVLALAWAVFTLFSYHRSSANAKFVGLIDLGFVGALIAGVYYLRFIASADCASIQPGSTVAIDLGIVGSASFTGFDVSFNKSCSMLKACFALGIMNIVFFFVTSIMAWIHGDHAVKSEKRYVETRRRSHSRGHSHSRHRSHSGQRHGSRRSSHSHHRAYV